MTRNARALAASLLGLTAVGCQAAAGGVTVQTPASSQWYRRALSTILNDIGVPSVSVILRIS